MAFIRASLALAFIVLLMSGCQSTPVMSPPALPEAPPVLDAQQLNLASLSEAADELGLDVQQYTTCSAIILWNGYNACWRPGTNVWMFYWPYGYNFQYCWSIGYATVGGWSSWQPEYDWYRCNR